MHTFLFTDIESSTEKWERFKDSMGEALKRHDAILAELISRFGGKIIKHTGDGVFAFFEQGSPLECAIEIQRRIGSEKWGKVGELRVRIAIHTGEAEKRGEDFFGTTVNRTARLLSAGWGGQILLTREVADTMTLPENVELVNLGFHVLKDLAEPQEVYGIKHPDLHLKDFPALKTLSAHPNNLPTQATQFIGRKPELEEIANLVKTPSCRLLTILGQGGIGKTRIALQAAAEMIDDFHHGVYFVALAALSRPEAIVPTVADALKFNFYSNKDPELELLGYLKEKKILLVLDNFEHLTEGAVLISSILKEAPQVKCIATSRSKLGLEAEWVFEVKGMRFPGASDIGDLETYSALELFTASARRSKPDFNSGPGEEEDILEICRLVGGLPLGIELAASWLRTLSLDEIVSEIKGGFDFLETSARDVPDRHRSLRDVFEYSWKLLSEEERKVLERISCFRGSATREAIEKITTASLFLLSSLVNKSLLQKVGSRYLMHEVIRQYAKAKLKKKPKDEQQTMDSHSDYFTALLSIKSEGFRGADVRKTLDELGADIENIRAAWVWASERGKEQWIDRSIDGLFNFYNTKGLFREGVRVLSEASNKLAHVSGVPDQIEKKGSLTQARLFRNQSAMLLNYASPDKAEILANRALAIARRAGSKKEEALVFNRLGTISFAKGDYSKAREFQTKSLEFFLNEGSKRNTASALLALGSIARDIGDFGESKSFYSKALDLYTEIGELRGQALILSNLGIIELRLGNLEESRRLQEESLELFRSIGSPAEVATTLSDIANVLRRMDEYDLAREHYTESLALNRELGNLFGIVITLNNMGNLARHVGDYDGARKLLTECIGASKELGRPLTVAICQGNLAGILLEKGDLHEAKEHVNEALRIAKDINAVPPTVDLLNLVAEIYAMEGKTERALEITGYVLEHPAAIKETLDRAQEFLGSMTPKPSTEDIARARVSAKKKEFKSLVDEILNAG